MAGWVLDVHAVGVESFIIRYGVFAYSWLGDGLLASMKTEVSPFFIGKQPMLTVTTSNGQLCFVETALGGYFAIDCRPAGDCSTSLPLRPPMVPLCRHANHQDVPEADLLDVSFEDGSATDTAQGVVSKSSGAKIADDLLNRVTADFDGDDAFYNDRR